jgi:hypothetical protein
MLRKATVTWFEEYTTTSLKTQEVQEKQIVDPPLELQQQENV